MTIIGFAMETFSLQTLRRSHISTCETWDVGVYLQTPTRVEGQHLRVGDDVNRNFQSRGYWYACPAHVTKVNRNKCDSAILNTQAHLNRTLTLILCNTESDVALSCMFVIV